METTIVFCIRSLTTRPTRTFLRLRVVAVSVMRLTPPSGGVVRAHGPGTRAASGLLRLLLFLLREHREQPRDLALALADLERVVELLHRVPEAQVEDLLAQLREPVLDLVHRLVPHRPRLHPGAHVTPLPAGAGPRSACASAAWT